MFQQMYPAKWITKETSEAENLAQMKTRKAQTLEVGKEAEEEVKCQIQHVKFTTKLDRQHCNIFIGLIRLGKFQSTQKMVTNKEHTAFS